jgi:hypothetical protein
VVPFVPEVVPLSPLKTPLALGTLSREEQSLLRVRKHALLRKDFSMHQKEFNVTWRLIALLSVLSIGISLFVMSPVLALAKTQINPLLIPIPTRDSVLFGIWRPDGSTVGSVHVKLDSGGLDQCVNLGHQNTVYGFGNVNGQDTITIEQYPNANCQGAEGVNRDPGKTYRGTVNSLAPGSADGGKRIYVTPKDA